MAIATLDDMIAAMGASTADTFSFYKSLIVQATGAWGSMFTANGWPGPAVTPSSGVAGDIPTDATPGAFPFTNPGAGDATYLSKFSVQASTTGVLYLYDRLWHNSGLSPTATGAQTVNSVPLTRPDALGEDVELWFQVYTAMGAGTPSITASYTDQDGNAGNTATLTGFSATANAMRTFPFLLASGDTGVRSVQSYTANNTMTSGTFGLVLRRRLGMISINITNQGTVQGPFETGLPDIPNDACLELVFICTTSGTFAFNGQLQLVQN